MTRLFINLLRQNLISWESLSSKPTSIIRRLQDKLLFDKLSTQEKQRLLCLYKKYLAAHKRLDQRRQSASNSNERSILLDMDRRSLLLTTLRLRSKQKSGRVKEVAENDHDHLVVRPGDETKIIWTYRLTGCSVVFLSADCQDGRRFSLMTHYNPTYLLKHLWEIKVFVEKQFPFLGSAQNKRALLLLRSDDGEKESEPGDFELLEMLLSKLLGDDLVVKRSLYFSDKQAKAVKNSDYGSMVVRVPPIRQGVPTYRTWYGDGYPEFTPVNFRAQPLGEGYTL